MQNLPDAILLVGPTGSGKTPLGQVLEARGLGGRPCAHFDFGEEIRSAVASGGQTANLFAPELDVLRQSLATGALLEDEQFPIARRILQAFLENRDTYHFPRRKMVSVPVFPWVVLNGLPRHAGQAEAMAAQVRVQAVVELDCNAAAVAARIRADAGGDRAGRVDDDTEGVRRKLDTYALRTAPLVDYYRRQGAAVITIPVGPTTSAEECRRKIGTLTVFRGGKW